jgi:hypothetical protein
LGVSTVGSKVGETNGATRYKAHGARDKNRQGGAKGSSWRLEVGGLGQKKLEKGVYLGSNLKWRA